MLPLIISAFIAGLLTFLAPCTLPLVPGYLGFISGVSAQEMRDKKEVNKIRKRIFLNGLAYVLGFSVIFVSFGTVFGLLGFGLGAYRIWLSRIGGVLVIFFGLYLMHVFRWKFLSVLHTEHRLNLFKKLRPGSPVSSFLFGMTFAFGWTPCVGPILGTILLLASSSATVWRGSLLLAVFSIGLGIPFLLIALSLSSATRYIQKMSKFLDVISFVGGVFLLFIGILLLTNHLGIWSAYFYKYFQFLNYDALMNYM